VNGGTVKPEIYSCLKMLESFKRSCVEIHNANIHGAASGLWKQYHLIEQRLSEHLTKEQMKFVPSVSPGSDFAHVAELSSAAGITISFLKSLEGSLAKELEAKERELTRKEEELDRLRKILTKAVEAVSQVPEARRSGWVAEMKKAHREIEEHSKPEDRGEKEKGSAP
jgi:hypothetical protein